MFSCIGRVCAVIFQESSFESSQTSHEPFFCFHLLFPHPHFPLSPSLWLSDIDKLLWAVQVIHLLRPQTQIFGSKSVLCLYSCSRFPHIPLSSRLLCSVVLLRNHATNCFNLRGEKIGQGNTESEKKARYTEKKERKRTRKMYGGS